MRDLSTHVAYSTERRSRLPLAAACLTLFAACADVASAAPLPVTNCNDAGSGSLRASIASAVDTDTISIPSSLGCSKITLRTGALAITQDNLSIEGPGADALTITGKYVSPGGTPTIEHDRLFTHTGAGKFQIKDVAMAKGYLIETGGSAARGGCLYSAGKLSVEDSSVIFCTAKSDVGYSAGGGMFARQGVYLGHSVVSYNTANAATGFSSGGGIAAANYFFAKYDTISNNTAGNSTSHKGTFGGFLSVHNGPSASAMVYTLIGSSTISNNYASLEIGGGGVVGTVSTLIDNLTVANNTTHGDVGGLYLAGYNSSVTNSTIAFNTAGTTALATGIHFQGYGADAKASLYSTIASNDFAGTGQGTDVGATGVTIAGVNNLVRFPATALPADTLRTCPLLAPLGNYGGQMLTIKLLGHSPAIDHGLNPLGSDVIYDGRGPGFARSSGPPGGSAIPDIGAYEVDRADEVFDNTFDAGCPEL